MAQVTAAMVKDLRERTQAGMSACKDALVEADGDMDKAVDIILKKGLAKAASKGGKIAAEGEVRASVSADGKRGTAVEVNCQTDFVARGEDFKGFVEKVVALANTLPKGADLLSQTLPGTEKTVELARQELTAKTGENIVVRRWDALDAPEPGGAIAAYVHMGGKIGVLVHATAPAEAAKSAAFTAFVDNCAMQIAAMSPAFVDKSQITQAAHDKQREIFEGQLKEEGKPEKAWPKIIEGKFGKWYSETTLLGQDRVWRDSDDDQGGTVDAYRVDLGKKLGGDVTVHSFLRFERGEGIEKKQDDLAAEVAKMVTA